MKIVCCLFVPGGAQNVTRIAKCHTSGTHHRREISGCRFLPQKHHEELRRANAITARLCALMILAHRAGTEFVIENPADRTVPQIYYISQNKDTTRCFSALDLPVP